MVATNGCSCECMREDDLGADRGGGHLRPSSLARICPECTNSTVIYVLSFLKRSSAICLCHPDIRRLGMALVRRVVRKQSEPQGGQCYPQLRAIHIYNTVPAEGCTTCDARKVCR